jgi:hypothetical protein
MWDLAQSIFARNLGHKEWIDIDVDTPENPEDALRRELESIKAYLYDKVGKGHSMLIRTGGGIHILVRKSAIKFNPQEIIDAVSGDLKEKNIPFKKFCRNIVVPLKNN